MKESKLTIGEPFALGAEQVAGVFAYKFAKLGFQVFISDQQHSIAVNVRKHELFNVITFQKGIKTDLDKMDKFFDEVKRALV